MLRMGVTTVVAGNCGDNVCDPADYLDLVEMIMAFEDEFSIEIPDEEAENIKTVKDIYTYIDNRLGEKSE